MVSIDGVQAGFALVIDHNRIAIGCVVRVRDQACDDEPKFHPALLQQQLNLLPHSQLEAGANANRRVRHEVVVKKDRELVLKDPIV